MRKSLIPLLATIFINNVIAGDEVLNYDYQKLRFDEDYTDKKWAESSDPLDRIKYLSGSGDSSWFVSLGGEVRERFEYSQNPVWGQEPEDNHGVRLQRLTFHSDVHVNQQLRGFLQLVAALEAGRENGPSPVDQNELEFQNAFLDIRLRNNVSSQSILRIGKQELNFGSGRLIDVREGPNVRRTFAAVRYMYPISFGKIHFFAAQPFGVKPGAFDDDIDDSVGVYGVYGVFDNWSNHRWKLDGYYLRYKSDSATFNEMTANELRHSYGVRFWGQNDYWDRNIELILQNGDFGDGEIRAWTVAVIAGRRWSDHSLAPRFEINVNIASGDKDEFDTDIETFNPLFPRGNYFSQAAVLGPRNFYNFHPGVSLHLADRFELTIDVNWYWRLETSDGIYTPSGQTIRSGRGSRSRFVGTALSLEGLWTIGPHTEVTAIFSRFNPGEFIKETGPAEKINFFEFTWGFKF